MNNGCNEKDESYYRKDEVVENNKVDKVAIDDNVTIDNITSNKHYQANVFSKDASKRFGTNSLLTPYPIHNHVNCDFLRYANINMIADEDSSSITEQYSNLLNETGAYKKLLDKSVKNQLSSADVQELRLVDDWLVVLVEAYPSLPVKKFFQHYLSCQKSVITKNIERSEVSTKNVKSIWERDAEVQLINSVLDDQRSKEPVERNVAKKCTDVKDIRLLFKKTVKRKIKNDEEKAEEKLEAVEEKLLNESIVNVEDFDDSVIVHNNESSDGFQKIEQASPEQQVEQASPIKINKIKINGFMRKAIQKRDQRRARRDRAKEFFNCKKQLNEEIPLCNTQIDDINIKNINVNSAVLIEESDSLPTKLSNSVNKSTEDAVLIKKSNTGKKISSKDIRAMFSKEEVVVEDSLSQSLSSTSVVKDFSGKKIFTKLLDVDDEFNITASEISANSITDTNFDGNIKCNNKSLKIVNCDKNIPVKLEQAHGSLDCSKQLNQLVSKNDDFKNEAPDNKKQLVDNVHNYNYQNLVNNNSIVNSHKLVCSKITIRTVIKNENDSKINSNSEIASCNMNFVNNDQSKSYEHSDGSENKVGDICKCLNLIGSEMENTKEFEKMNVRRSSRHKRKVDYFENNISPQKTDTRAKMFKKTDKLQKSSILMSSAPQELHIVKKEFDKDMDKNDLKIDLDKKKITQLKSSQFKDNSTKVKPAIELILNEVVVNSFLSWTEKYQPTKPRFVLGSRSKVRELFEWLNSWKERHDLVAQRTSKRNDSESESDLSIFSDDENSFISTLLLTGPIGCGTTAAVVACAKQMQFKILEINPSILRTGKHVLDRVAEAVVSHQIQKNHTAVSKTSFFSCKSDKKEQVVATSQVAADEISLVLFEHVDIVYDDHDKGFWQGLNSLCRQSKRPIILTANDPSTIIYDDKGESVWMESIELERPSTEQLLPMMQIICLIEHVFIPSEILLEIIKFCNNDVRKTMLQLQFWFEQGKEPMYKLWKERSQSKALAVMNDSPSQFYSDKKNNNLNNSSVADNTLVETKDSSLLDSSEISNHSNKKVVEIMIPRINLNNFWKNPAEEFFNIESISSYNLWSNQCIDSHHTFIKKTSQLATGDHLLHNLGNMIDCISDMDCYLHSRYLYEEKDIYQWSASLKDSLVDSLTTESCVPNPYPISDMLESTKLVVENCYEKRCGKNEKLVFIQHRTNQEDLVFQTLIESKMPTSSQLDHRHFYQDVLPCLRNMCSSEEQKRVLQDRRRSRRFLHYLDSISLCLDENVLKTLSSSPFSVF